MAQKSWKERTVWDSRCWEMSGWKSGWRKNELRAFAREKWLWKPWVSWAGLLTVWEGAEFSSELYCSFERNGQLFLHVVASGAKSLELSKLGFLFSDLWVVFLVVTLWVFQSKRILPGLFTCILGYICLNPCLAVRANHSKTLFNIYNSFNHNRHGILMWR